MRSLDAGLLFAYIYPVDACGEISMCGSTQRVSAAIDKLSRSQNGRGSVCVLYVRYEKRNAPISLLERCRSFVFVILILCLASDSTHFLPEFPAQLFPSIRIDLRLIVFVVSVP